MLFKNKFVAVASLLISVAVAGCSSKETNESYDKYYGKERDVREQTAYEKDSVLRAKEKQVREMAPAPVAPTAAEPVVSKVPSAEIAGLLEKNTCSVCHKATERLVGPAFSEIAKKNYTAEQIVELVHNPKPEHWPDYPPMAPLAHVTKDDIIKIAGWINSL